MDLQTAQKVLSEALEILDQNEQHLAAIHVASAIHLLTQTAQPEDTPEALERLVSVK